MKHNYDQFKINEEDKINYENLMSKKNNLFSKDADPFYKKQKFLKKLPQVKLTENILKVVNRPVSNREDLM